MSFLFSSEVRKLGAGRERIYLEGFKKGLMPQGFSFYQNIGRKFKLGVSV